MATYAAHNGRTPYARALQSVFAIGTDYDTRREFIRKHRALYKIDCVLNEWFDDVKPLSIEEYLGEK